MRNGFSITTMRPNMTTSSGYRFGAHAFAPGEYVSIRDDGGELHTFRVLSVSNAT